MYKFHLELFAIFAAFSGLVLAAEYRVIGGETIPITKAPYQVFIMYPTSFCGGSLISRDLVLTAAHCNAHQGNIVRPSDVFVFAGIEEIGSIVQGASFNNFSQVLWVKVHPLYIGRQDYKHDIGLIKLQKPVELSDKIAVVPLKQSRDYPNGSCLTTGWGMTHDQQFSYDLQGAMISIVGLRACRKFFFTISKSFLPSNHMVCASEFGSIGTCSGDSGGPLVCDGKQVGIVSYGMHCSFMHPRVYTSVGWYKNWIERNVGNQAPISPILIIITIVTQLIAATFMMKISV